MKSTASYLDVVELSRWIAGHLEKEGLTVSERLVSRILNHETLFMLMIGLAEAGNKNTVRAGYVRREAAWVVDPGAQVQGHEELSQGRRRDEQGGAQS